MHTIIGYSRFNSKKGTPLVALYCESERANVTGKYCECFIVTPDKLPADFDLGMHAEFSYAKNSSYVDKVYWHD